MALSFTAEGKEILDPTPVELPLGYDHPPTLQELIAQCIRTEAFKNENQELESFEEFDDMEILDDDSDDLNSQYQRNMVEMDYDGPEQDAKNGSNSEPATTTKAETKTDSKGDTGQKEGDSATP